MTNSEQVEDVKPNMVSCLAARSRFGELPIGASVTLYEGPLILRKQEETATGAGKITFEFVPGVSVRFVMETDQQIMPLFLLEDDFAIEMVNLGRTAKVQVSKSHQSWPSGAATISGNLAENFEFSKMRADGSPESIGRAQFHVLNFHDFRGEQLHTSKDGREKQWAGRVQFEFDKWIVTLDALPDLKERRDLIKSQGGLAVTHIGDLRRKDGKLFPSQKASELLGFLHWFLSFVNGSRCGCVLSSGLRYLDYPLWEDWAPLITRPSRSSQSWFAKNLPKECLSIAERFYSFWRDKDKRDWLQLTVSIYTDSNSNTSGTDLELTKAQIALEMLCWVVLREENAIVSEEGLEKLPAADRIRLLLSMCGIPLLIPAHLGDLEGSFKSTVGADGPLATTEIRNSVVHPTKKNRERWRGYSNMAKFDAWQLNMWYVELVMLRLFGYKGQYNNRLDRASWEGTYELVPWAQSPGQYDLWI